MQDFFTEVKENSSGIGYFTLDGQKNIASYLKSDYMNMYIVCFMPIERYAAAANQIKGGLAIAIIAGILIFSSIIIIFLRKITKPISVAVEYLKQVAEGDFSSNIPDEYLRGNDETGILMRSIDMTQKSIRDIIKTVIHESDRLDDSVNITNNSISELNQHIADVSATTQEMSAGMEQTAASTEEMDASSNELENFFYL